VCYSIWSYGTGLSLCVRILTNSHVVLFFSAYPGRLVRHFQSTPSSAIVESSITTSTRDVLFKWNKDNITRLQNGLLIYVFGSGTLNCTQYSLIYYSLPIREQAGLEQVSAESRSAPSLTQYVLKSHLKLLENLT